MRILGFCHMHIYKKARALPWPGVFVSVCGQAWLVSFEYFSALTRSSQKKPDHATGFPTLGI